MELLAQVNVGNKTNISVHQGQISKQLQAFSRRAILLRKSFKQLCSCVNEVEALKKVQHNLHTVQYIDRFALIVNNSLWIVMELENGLPLCDVLQYSPQLAMVLIEFGSCVIIADKDLFPPHCNIPSLLYITLSIGF